MRIEILALAALVAAGCAHKPAPAAAVHIPDLDYSLPGDEPVPIWAAADVVGRYRSILNDEVIIIYVDSGELMFRSSHGADAALANASHRIGLGSNGRLGLGTHGAALVRRRGRVMLHVGWCYRWGIYWREERHRQAS